MEHPGSSNLWNPVPSTPIEFARTTGILPYTETWSLPLLSYLPFFSALVGRPPPPRRCFLPHPPETARPCLGVSSELLRDCSGVGAVPTGADRDPADSLSVKRSSGLLKKVRARVLDRRPLPSHSIGSPGPALFGRIRPVVGPLPLGTAFIFGYGVRETSVGPILG